MKTIRKQADAENLNLIRVDAVDGFELTTKKMLTKGYITPLNFFTKGTVGCYLSHRKVWTKIAEGEAPYALVIEDDVVFAKQFLTKLEEVLVATPMDWDMLYLGMTRPYGNHIGRNIYRAGYKLNTNAGAYAYILKRDARANRL